MQDVSCELERASSLRRDIAGDVVFQLVGPLARHIGISISKRGGARYVFISLGIYERVKRREKRAFRTETDVYRDPRCRGGVCIYESRAKGKNSRTRSAREIRDTHVAYRERLFGALDVARCGPQNTRPARRFSGRAALFITTAAGAQAATLCRYSRSQPESPRYNRPDIILLYLRSEHGRVVYQPSESRFSLLSST